MKIVKFTKIFLVCFLLPFISCVEDEGNYTYEDKSIITIDIPVEISVLANAEYIDIKPVITSSVEGDIEEGNPNFEFSCMRSGDSSERWVDLNPEKKKDIYMMANLGVGTYTCYYAVTDKRTGVAHKQLFKIKVVSTTYEGWMILCDEGEERRARLDMLAQLSSTRYVAAYDVIKRTSDVPEMYRAASLGFFANRRGTIGNNIVFMTETGGYILDNTSLEMSGASELKTTRFASSPEDNIVNFTCIPRNDVTNHDAIISVSKEGNAFAWYTQASGGAFEDPINTSVRGSQPEYKVAPFVGATLKRNDNLPNYGVALLYDITNHRFIGWDSDRDSKQTCYPLTDPAASEKKFSFNTGGMNLVTMINTAFSGGIVYCVMQDGSKRHIYAINLSNKDFKQDGCYLDIQAPNFDKATCFAASSQYPVIYYGYANKVYAYNTATKETKEAITFDAKEEITLLKFNMYDEPEGVALLTGKMSEEFKAAFTARQFELIVGTYNKEVTDSNGGILRFYQTSSPGMTLTFKPGWEYKGYARIKDVRYKEVRP